MHVPIYRHLMRIESAIIGNAQTTDDINLIYINRPFVPKANLSFRFIQLLFNFMNRLQIILHCNIISFGSAQHYFNLLKRKSQKKLIINLVIAN